MASVVVADYGIGNLLSVCRALEHCGAEVSLSGDGETIRGADRLVVPGVGAFGDCVRELQARNLQEPILEFTRRERPFLGICVGMQMMLDFSEEFGRHAGFGLVPGKVAPVPAKDASGRVRKVPFIGWAELKAPANADWHDSILDDVQPGNSVYFVHSFAAYPTDSRALLATYESDGAVVAAAIRSGSLFGCQFHPEKSGDVGLRILARFLAL